MNVIIQLFTGAAGSVGFGLIFHINKKYLPVTAVGGAFGWLAYLLLSHHGNHIFVSMLVASFCVAIYAEILARVYGAPSTPFFVTSAIPLIPGSTLYYCRRNTEARPSCVHWGLPGEWLSPGVSAT